MLSISSNYTKDIHVFYDSLFHIEKLANEHDILTIYKLDFDYSTASINQKNIPLKIDFGDSNRIKPFEASRNCYVDSILLEAEKAILIIGLEWISADLTQTISGSSHIGNVYNPIIYKYDINNHSLKKIYPKTEDLGQWQHFLQGDKVVAQVPLVSYDNKNDRLGFIFKTTRKVDGITKRTYIDIDFIYQKDSLKLENVRVLSAENTNGVYNSTIIFQRYVNHNGQKILIAAGSTSNKKKILIFKLGPSEISAIDPEREFYILTEDSCGLLTEDGEQLLF